jgi:DNA polymerase III subunit gamma/tau
MRGATAPRLLLELICARVLLPGADHGSDGVMARLERLERRVAIGGTPSGTTPAPAAVPPQVAAPAVGTTPTPEPEPAPAPTPEPTPEPEPTAETAPQPAPEPAPAGGLSLVDVRRLWPDIVEAVKARRRLTWIHLTQHAQVVAVDGTTLTLGFSNAGARESFDGGGSAEIVRQAAIDVVGTDWKVESIVDPGAQPPPTQSPVTPAPAPEPTVALEPPTVDEPVRADPGAVAAAREAIQQTRATSSGSGRDSVDDPRAAADAEAHPDDDDIDASGLAGAELLQQQLGAEVIEEIKHH